LNNDINEELQTLANFKALMECKHQEISDQIYEALVLHLRIEWNLALCENARVRRQKRDIEEMIRTASLVLQGVTDEREYEIVKASFKYKYEAKY